MHPGGALARLNFLEPHLETLLQFIGLADVTHMQLAWSDLKPGDEVVVRSRKPRSK